MHPKRPKVETVQDYMQLLPVDTQKILNQLRSLVKEVVPEAKEVISYAIPAYKLPGQGRAFVYISVYAKHVGVYPRPHDASAELEEKLNPFVAGRGTLKFMLDKPLPLGLIKQAVLQLYTEQKK